MLLGEDEVESGLSGWAGRRRQGTRDAIESGGTSVSKGPEASAEPDLKEPVGLRRAAAGDGTEKIAQQSFDARLRICTSSRGPQGLKDLCFIKTVDLPRGMFLSKRAPLRCY